MSNTEKNHEMTVEEFVTELKRLKEQNEDLLDKATEKLADLEDNEPDSDGVKYERWQDKCDAQQCLIEAIEERLDKINSYLEEYDTSEV